MKIPRFPEHSQNYDLRAADDVVISPAISLVSRLQSLLVVTSSSLASCFVSVGAEEGSEVRVRGSDDFGTSGFGVLGTTPPLDGCVRAVVAGLLDLIEFSGVRLPLTTLAAARSSLGR